MNILSKSLPALVAWSIMAAPVAAISEDPSGVVVLSVDKNSAGATVGIQEGDTILGWLQADQKGTIGSPLDFLWLERERGPRGKLTLVGRRSSIDLSWTLSGPLFGIKAGPGWSAILPIHGRMRELARANELSSLVDYCRLTCAQVSSSSGARSWAFFEAANWLSQSVQWKDAAEFFEDAIAAAEPNASHQRAIIREVWADSLKKYGDLASASDQFQKALIESKTTDQESLAVAYDLYNLALVKFDLGDLANAELLDIQALHIRRKLYPSSLDVVHVLKYLGVFSLKNGDIDSAEDYLNQSLTLAEKLSPTGRDTAFALNNLGAAAEKRGDLAHAEQYYLRDLNITKRSNPNDYLLSYSWSNLGTIAFQRGNLTRSKQYHLTALSIQQQHGRDTDVAMTLNNLAIVAGDSGELLEAERLLRRALEIQLKSAPNSLELGQTLDSLGTILRKQKRLHEAEENLKRALPLRQQVSPNSLEAAETIHHLAEVSLDMGNAEQAEKLFEAGRQIRYALAPSSAPYADSLVALANLARAQKHWTVASSNYEAALRVLDFQNAQVGGATESRFRFHNKYAAYYAQYVSVLMQQGETVHAFETLERSRAQTLLQMLRGGDVHVHEGVSARLLREDQRLRFLLAGASDERLQTLLGKHTDEQASTVDRRIVELQSERERLLANIRASSPRFSSLIHPPPLRLAAMQRLLDAQTMLLEYSVTSEGSYVFALTGGNLISFPLPDSHSINDLAQQVYDLWSSRAPRNLNVLEHQPERDGLTAAPRRLSNIVLRPVKALLDKYQRIVIVGDSKLSYIPFGSLPSPSLLTKEVLLNSTHEIVYLPSASVLLLSRQESKRDRTNSVAPVSIIADPVFSRNDPRVQSTLSARYSLEKSKPNSTEFMGLETINDESVARDLNELTRLRYSRAEADAVADLLPRGHVHTALDFEATRTMATSPSVLNSRVVHFATHGFFDSNHPELSGLIFALVTKNGTSQVGLWSLEDIFNSPIRSDLVVLSACQTATGQSIEGEGLIGLTWGFAYAGAKTVVASLWNVNDASTAELMRLFYEGMIRQRMTPTKALHSAQLIMSRQSRWADPYYWAGFVIEGDWRTNPLF